MIKAHLLTPFLLLTGSLFAQITDFVRPDLITLPIYKEHIGTIAFMEKVIPIEQFNQPDFLRSFELKEKADNIIADYLIPAVLE